MKLPNKLTSYKESILFLLPIILDKLKAYDMAPIELYESLKDKASLPEYIEALDCLYMMGKIEFNEQRGVLHHVA